MQFKQSFIAKEIGISQQSVSCHENGHAPLMFKYALLARFSNEITKRGFRIKWDEGKNKRHPLRQIRIG